MSADNWTVCPQCQMLDPFMGNEEMTLREDYEVGIYDDGCFAVSSTRQSQNLAAIPPFSNAGSNSARTRAIHVEGGGMVPVGALRDHGECVNQDLSCPDCGKVVGEQSTRKNAAVGSRKTQQSLAFGS